MNRFVAAAMALLLGLQPPAAFAWQSESASENTKTPIKHLVVIFDENVSFDHYSEFTPRP
jgi:phospholipase C